MNLEQRIDLLKKLGEYIISDDENWADIKEKAYYENTWFIPDYINFHLNHIASEYLSAHKLKGWTDQYNVPGEKAEPRKIGIVMAGNIPLAGFHDFLATFVSGHRQIIKPSSKDNQLIGAIIKKLVEWNPDSAEYFSTADQLRGCYAYIATGSNNSSRYFDYYFSKYPHIIRRNRTSAGILTGNETIADLEALSDDVYLYFGLGCRNVTKIYVPQNYDFLPLLNSFKKYTWTFDTHKYKNNYDYQLAIMIINKVYYMTNGSILLQENKGLFSPISLLHYEYYSRKEEVEKFLDSNPDIQCVVGKGYVPFGSAQQPALDDYADKADTLNFLLNL